jgi:hypothetical protein
MTISPIFQIIGNNKTNVGFNFFFNFTNFIYFYKLELGGKRENQI